MSAPRTPPGQQKFYDPAEVEAYVAQVTKTMRALQARLHEAQRRAEQAEWASQELADNARPLVQAQEFAQRTVAEAEARAAAIVRAAEDRAAAIVGAANDEADHLVDMARGAAADVFVAGEARLLAAISAFVEGSNILRAEMARIEESATSWRRPACSAMNGQPTSAGALPGRLARSAG